MTEALFLTVSECEEERREQGKRRLNVSGVLKILGAIVRKDSPLFNPCSIRILPDKSICF